MVVNSQLWQSQSWHGNLFLILLLLMEQFNWKKSETCCFGSQVIMHLVTRILWLWFILRFGLDLINLCEMDLSDTRFIELIYSASILYLLPIFINQYPSIFYDCSLHSGTKGLLEPTSAVLARCWVASWTGCQFIAGPHRNNHPHSIQFSFLLIHCACLWNMRGSWNTQWETMQIQGQYTNKKKPEQESNPGSSSSECQVLRRHVALQINIIILFSQVHWEW